MEDRRQTRNRHAWRRRADDQFAELFSKKRGRPLLKNQKMHPSAPRESSSFASERDKWSLNDKLKLLEGLKRYNEHPQSLAQWMETKTVEEIEKMISEMKETNSLRRSKGHKEKDENNLKAPLNKWISLIRDMTYYEHADFSELISVVFGLIARNEELPPPGPNRPDYKKIYTYLAAILDDRATPPELNAIDSAVVLDLMDQLGASMRHLETYEQRHIMDFKYQLLGACQGNQNKAQAYYMNEQALRNDFWDAEESAPPASQTDATEIAGRSGPSTSAQDVTVNPSSLISTAPGPNSDSITQPLSEHEPTSSSSSSRMEQPSKSADTIRNNDAQTHTVTNARTDPVAGSSRMTDVEEPTPGPSSTSVSDDSTYVGQSQNSKLVIKLAKLKKDIMNTSLNLNNPGNLQNVFKKPKFFTMNPLCVPARLMAIKKHKVSVDRVEEHNRDLGDSKMQNKRRRVAHPTPSPQERTGSFMIEVEVDERVLSGDARYV